MNSAQQSNLSQQISNIQSNQQTNQVQQLCFLANATTQVCLTVSPLPTSTNGTNGANGALSTQFSAGGNVQASTITDNSKAGTIQGIGGF